jgi:glc operon protein GlcG
MALVLPTKKSLTLEAARVAMAASEAQARQGGWRVVIAVVDDGGHPILLARLDGAQISSIDTAVGKARAAVAWKRPTRLLEESVNNGRHAFLSIAQGMALLRGACRSRSTGKSLARLAFPASRRATTRSSRRPAWMP